MSDTTETPPYERDATGRLPIWEPLRTPTNVPTPPTRLPADECTHPNCELHGKSPCTGVDCTGADFDDRALVATNTDAHGTPPLDPAYLLVLAERRKTEGLIDAPLTLTLDQQIAILTLATKAANNTHCTACGRPITRQGDRWLDNAGGLCMPNGGALVRHTPHM